MPQAATSNEQADANSGGWSLWAPAAALLLLASAAAVGIAAEHSDEPTRLNAIFGLLFVPGTILLGLVAVLVQREFAIRRASAPQRLAARAGVALCLFGLLLGGVWAHGYAFLGLPPLVLGCVLLGVALRDAAPRAALALAIVPLAAATLLAVTFSDLAAFLYTISIPACFAAALLELRSH